MVSRDWQSQIFEKKKKKKKKKMAARIWVQNEFFAILLNLDHTFSLKLHTVIACNHS